MKKFFFISLLTCLMSCAAPVTKRHSVNAQAMANEAEMQRVIALQAQKNRQERLSNVAQPIMIANVQLCGEKTKHIYGFQPVVVESFSKQYQAAAKKGLKASSTPSVLYTIKGTPAARAGIKPGDVFLGVNDEPIPVGKKSLEKLSELLQKSNGVVSLRMARPGRGEYRADLRGVMSCDFPVIVSDMDGINAYADGEAIYFTKDMMRFAENDSELAVIMGHELAHNIMGHIDKKTTNAIGGMLVDILLAATLGVDTQAAFTKIGAQAYSQDFEAESDYVGLYLTARGGYPVKNAPYFWRRMAAEHPGNIKTNHSATHPPTPERFLTLERTVREIDHKRSMRLALVPELDEKASVSSGNASAAIAALNATGGSAPLETLRTGPHPHPVMQHTTTPGASESAPNNIGRPVTSLKESDKPKERSRGSFYDEARNAALSKRCNTKVDFTGQTRKGNQIYTMKCGGATKMLACSEKLGCRLLN